TAAGTEEPITLQYRQAVVDLAFSPNGGLLACLGRHGEGALRQWQPQARGRDGLEGGGRRPHGQLPVAALRTARADASRSCANARCCCHREDLTAFDLAASSTRLLTAGHEGEVAVWDAVAGADPPLLGQWLAAPGPAPAARCPRSRRCGPWWSRSRPMDRARRRSRSRAPSMCGTWR